MSRHKSLKTDIVSLQPKSGAHAIQPKNNVSIKTHKTRENTLKSPAVLKSTIAATKEKCRSSGTASGQSNTLKTENVAQHRSSSSSSSVYLDNKIHLNLKDPVRKQNVPDNLSCGKFTVQICMQWLFYCSVTHLWNLIYKNNLPVLIRTPTCLT